MFLIIFGIITSVFIITVILWIVTSHFAYKETNDDDDIEMEDDTDTLVE